MSQVCNEDGMEFTLRLPEGFYGRMYTYGFYDRCFFRGNGGVVNALRITGSHGYPECGTQRVSGIKYKPLMRGIPKWNLVEHISRHNCVILMSLFYVL